MLYICTCKPLCVYMCVYILTHACKCTEKCLERATPNYYQWLIVRMGMKLGKEWGFHFYLIDYTI